MIGSRQLAALLASASPHQAAFRLAAQRLAFGVAERSNPLLLWSG